MEVNNLNLISNNSNIYSNSISKTESNSVSNVEKSENKDYTTLEREKLNQKIDSLLEKVNEKLKPINKEICYELHDKVDRYIVTIKDRDSGEVIKEIPAREQVDAFAKILEASGLLFDGLS